MTLPRGAGVRNPSMWMLGLIIAGSIAWLGGLAMLAGRRRISHTFPDACLNCDYSLESLPANGVCPECGHAFNKAKNARVREIRLSGEIRVPPIALLVILLGWLVILPWGWFLGPPGLGELLIVGVLSAIPFGPIWVALVIVGSRLTHRESLLAALLPTIMVTGFMTWAFWSVITGSGDPTTFIVIPFYAAGFSGLGFLAAAAMILE